MWYKWSRRASGSITDKFRWLIYWNGTRFKDKGEDFSSFLESTCSFAELSILVEPMTSASGNPKKMNWIFGSTSILEKVHQRAALRVPFI
ncbi:hypothetical protein TNCV_1610341 [Trichonephila clavipes]|nr:hypothetical protein TNCV_1610341 [Trichonephila clavipes]